MSGMKIMLFVLVIGFIVPALWTSIPAIKETAHAILDPIAGALLLWNLNLGFIIIIAVLTLISTILYKYTTDQKTLKEIKDEQKLLQAEMKKYKDHPEKFMEYQKKSMELTMKVLPMAMRPTIYTIIPVILLFKWFTDFFAANPSKIFGFMHWLLAYIIISIIISSIFRKMLKVS